MPEIALIPKDYKRRLSLETVFSKIGIFIFALVAICLLVFAGLYFYNQSLAKQIEETKDEIGGLSQQRDIAFELETKHLDETLNSLKIILKSHLYWSNVFSVFEEKTVPQVVFSDFSGIINQDGSVLVGLQGETGSYTYLAKQLVSFAEEKLISGLDLSSINLGSQGGIEFSLSVEFSKEILSKITK